MTLAGGQIVAQYCLLIEQAQIHALDLHAQLCAKTVCVVYGIDLYLNHIAFCSMIFLSKKTVYTSKVRLHTTMQSSIYHDLFKGHGDII